MDERDFVVNNQESWRRLAAMQTRVDSQGIKSLKRDELRDFSSLYRLTASHLAYSRTHKMNSTIQQSLNVLVARGFAQLAHTDTTRWRGFFGFLKYDLPIAFRRKYRFFLAALFFTLVGACSTYSIVMRDKSNIEIFFPPNSQFRASVEYWKQGKTNEGKPDSEAARMTSFYIANNTKVSFLSFALGIFGGVLTALLLIQNGIVLGALTAAITQVGQHRNYWPALLPHGVVELSAIFISSAAGLSIGWALLIPGPYSRRDAIQMAAREAVPLVIGTIFMLLFAGFVEAFISHSTLGRGLKIAFGVLSGIALYGYLLTSGRTPASSSLKADSVL